MWKRSLMVVAATVALTACAETPAPVAPDADFGPAFNNVNTSYGNLDLNPRRTSVVKNGDGVKVTFRITGAGSKTVFVGAAAASVSAQVQCKKKSDGSIFVKKTIAPQSVTPSPANGFEPDRQGNVSGTLYLSPPTFISDGTSSERCPQGHNRIVVIRYTNVALGWGDLSGVQFGSVSSGSLTPLIPGYGFYEFPWQDPDTFFVP